MLAVYRRIRRSCGLAVVVILCVHGAVFGQPGIVGWRARLACDINPGPAGSSPESFLNANGRLYFSAGDGTHGRELWRSDGTVYGTRMVHDVNPGIADGTANTLLVGERNVFFTADDGVHGRELWISDGTEAGTKLVRDVRPDIQDGSSNTIAFSENRVYFAGNDGVSGWELWVSDGSAPGTQRVRDINPGIQDGVANTIAVREGRVFFRGNDGATGWELWTSDGTPAGTRLVRDIRPGIADGTSNTLVLSERGAFLGANDGINGEELWFSDGTEAGTRMLRDINPYGGTSLTFGDGSVRFISGVNNDGLFFGAGYPGGGSGLWYTDGTAAGTRLVRNVNPAGDAQIVFGDGSVRFLGRNGDIFFTANDGSNGRELWCTDGTPTGTRLVRNVGPAIQDGASNTLAFAEGRAFFPGNEGVNGWEPWVSDGTETGTRLVWDVYPGGDANPVRLTDINGTPYFAANNGAHGQELWRAVPIAASRSLGLGDGWVLDTALVSPTGLGTETRLTSDRIAGAQNLSLAFASSNDLLASDTLTLTYSGSDVYLLEMVYDEATAAARFGREGLTRLGWFDTPSGHWRPAVEGSTGGAAQYVAGPWDGNLILGRHGLDVNTNTVWAVLDQDGAYAAIGVPEPDADGDGVADVVDRCPNTIRGVSVDVDGCPPLVPGDFDRDGDADGGDLDTFESCASGPAIAYAGDCGKADFDSDGDVDQSDFGIIQRCYSGEGNPADPNCN